MTEWQWIDTAPLDGTDVLIYAEDYQVVAYYKNGLWRDGDMIWHPTHWMPLPTPPRFPELSVTSEAMQRAHDIFDIRDRAIVMLRESGIDFSEYTEQFSKTIYRTIDVQRENRTNRFTIVLGCGRLLIGVVNHAWGEISDGHFVELEHLFRKGQQQSEEP